jgi:competence protein ComEC
VPAAGAYLAAGVLGVGIFFGEALGPSPAVSTLVLAGSFAVAAVLVRGPRARVGLVLAVLACVGCALERRALDGLVHWPLAEATQRRSDVVIRGTLVDDPDGTRWSAQVLVRVDSARVDDGRTPRVGGGDGSGFLPVRRTVLVDAEGDAVGRLSVLAAGDDVVLRGWLRPLEGFDERLRWRHVVATMAATDLLDASGPASPLAEVANQARGVVLRGTDALPATERALVAGFLLGDTRDLPEVVEERFRAAGLSHLLAVSGGNVAFVLALAGPGLRRLPRPARLAAALAVLLVFGAMTRWEPSVLRACAMAALAVVAVHTGRPAQAVRLLALAVTGLLLVDPFLVHSVGFLLSVGASLGIALLAVPIARWLRGPAWFREPLATTAAAQIGVAPILIPVFGSVPLVALPANLLAVPLVGPLTIWGLVAGTMAGVMRSRVPPAATALQWPTHVLADAVLGIADAASRVPLEVGAPHVGAAVGVAAVVAVLVAAPVALPVAVRVLARRRPMLRRRALVLPPR